MNDWIAIAFYALGGIMTIGAATAGYLYRELKTKTDDTSKALGDFKIHVAGSYAPRSEIGSMFDSVRKDIKDARDEIKDFIDAKFGNLK